MKSGNKLCLKCGSSSTRWLPNDIKGLESIIYRKIPREKNYKYGLGKNICYNLQHLEFIACTFEQLHLTTVIKNQNYKTFVIISCSIIEGVLYHEIRNKGLGPKWTPVKKIASNERVAFGKKIRLETEIFQEAEDGEVLEMTFDQMLKKAEKKKLLGGNKNIYASINKLRKLRNKIHIHLALNTEDTDYNSFVEENYLLAKKTLLEIIKIYFTLSAEEISSFFYFLSD